MGGLGPPLAWAARGGVGDWLRELGLQRPDPNPRGKAGPERRRTGPAPSCSAPHLGSTPERAHSFPGSIYLFLYFFLVCFSSVILRLQARRANIDGWGDEWDWAVGHEIHKGAIKKFLFFFLRTSDLNNFHSCIEQEKMRHKRDHNPAPLTRSSRTGESG